MSLDLGKWKYKKINGSLFWILIIVGHVFFSTVLNFFIKISKKRKIVKKFKLNRNEAYGLIF